MQKKPLATLLNEGRRKIQVTDDELAEAKRRRSLLTACMRRAFPGSTCYFNGSVAHGDANTPPDRCRPRGHPVSHRRGRLRT